MRSNQQNKLYHELCGQLHTHKSIKVYDGRFSNLGYTNPIVFRPSAFGYDTFRELIKAIDLSYPRDNKGKVLSSAKLNTEQMNSHITFLEVLLTEV